MKVLLLGAGHKFFPECRLSKGIINYEEPKKFYREANITRIDINPDCKPDVLHDLNKLPLPFKDDEFDEIHAYEVLEHMGRQGDYESFFDLFNELGRILKPGGKFIGCVPRWERVWAWSDPGHCRIITRGSLMYLDKDNYEGQIGTSHISDYRRLVKYNLNLVAEMYNEFSFYFVLLKN